MATNIEIKAYLNDIQSCRNIAKSLAQSNGQIIKQEDIFFHCETGRLKLRVFSDNHGELIFYQRNDQPGPKSSQYEITATQEPYQLKIVLARAYPTRGVVKKVRTLFLVGRTRIHLDQVEGLGDFIELEVVLSQNDTAKSGIEEAHALMQQLGVNESDLIDCAYIDLLEQKSAVS